MEPLFSIFADLLGYPAGALLEPATQAIAALAAVEPGAAEELRGFQRYLLAVEPGGLEERYTTLFDLPASCPPYAGYQLLGEDWRRNLLLARLNQRYRQRGFSPGSELPDHVTVLLRYLAREEHGSDEEELLSECLLPALERMAAQLGEEDQGYGALLRGICLWLRARAGAARPR